MPDEPGRNDPCPCGSGKKYKKCCYLTKSEKFPPEEMLRQRLFVELVEFAKKSFNKRVMEEAWELFWDGRYPEDNYSEEQLNSTYIIFLDWLITDWQPEDDGVTITDYFLETRHFSDVETDFLKRMKDSVTSIFEVQGVVGDIVTIKDIFLDDTYELAHNPEDVPLLKWDIFATRPLLVDGLYVSAGGIRKFPIEEKANLIENILYEYKQYQADDPELTMRGFFKTYSDLINLEWNDINLGSDDEDCEFPNPVRAVYEIVDRERVVTGVAAIDGVVSEGDQETYLWADSDGQTLGGIFIEDGQLYVMCEYMEQLEACKEKLTAALGDSVNHITDEEIDLGGDGDECGCGCGTDDCDVCGDDGSDEDEVVADEGDEAASDDDPELTQGTYDSKMRSILEKFFTASSEAFDGKTLPEAVQDEIYREDALNVVKQFENTEEQRRTIGMIYHDMAWVWEKLGVKG